MKDRQPGGIPPEVTQFRAQTPENHGGGYRRANNDPIVSNGVNSDAPREAITQVPGTKTEKSRGLGLAIAGTLFTTGALIASMLPMADKYADKAKAAKDEKEKEEPKPKSNKELQEDVKRAQGNPGGLGNKTYRRNQ